MLFNDDELKDFLERMHFVRTFAKHWPMALKKNADSLSENAADLQIKHSTRRSLNNEQVRKFIDPSEQWRTMKEINSAAAYYMFCQHSTLNLVLRCQQAFNQLLLSHVSRLTSNRSIIKFFKSTAELDHRTTFYAEKQVYYLSKLTGFDFRATLRGFDKLSNYHSIHFDEDQYEIPKLKPEKGIISNYSPIQFDAFDAEMLHKKAQIYESIGTQIHLEISMQKNIEQEIKTLGIEQTAIAAMNMLIETDSEDSAAQMFDFLSRTPRWFKNKDTHFLSVTNMLYIHICNECCADYIDHFIEVHFKDYPRAVIEIVRATRFEEDKVFHLIKKSPNAISKTILKEGLLFASVRRDPSFEKWLFNTCGVRFTDRFVMCYPFPV